MRIPRRSLVVLLAVLVVACSGNLPPNASPQMKIAKYGGDVMASLRVLATTTAKLEEQLVLPTALAGDLMVVFHNAGLTGQQLSTLLTAYDNAVNKGEWVTLIEEQLKTLDALMGQALKLANQDAAGKQVSALIQKVLALVITIHGALPPPAIVGGL